MSNRQALAAHEAPGRVPGAGPRSLLRVATCGSVDDGKSTLIGRLLFDAGLVADDHLEVLRRESRGRPCSPEGYDLSLLVDGLMAEREQGITIDVAYRYFSTGSRSFIVADSPGHEQYTRNMATAASTSETAILLIDARKGVLEQTRRHATILGMLGIRRVAAVVNKMDLVAFDRARFESIVEELGAIAAQAGLSELTPIPVSALDGDNVVRRSARTLWHDGPSLLQWLESVEAGLRRTDQPFRLQVQWVNRPNADFRGFSGRIASGILRRGDPVTLVGSPPRSTKVSRILTPSGESDLAGAGESVTLVLSDEIDIGRGDVLSEPARLPTFANQFTADVIWFGEHDLIPGRSYVLRLGTTFVPATVTDIKYRLSIHSGEHAAAKTLATNEVGHCNLATDHPVAFEPYADSPDLGAFILIDRTTNDTVGAGMIRHALNRATNVVWQDFDTSRVERAAMKRQQPLIVWLTGLSGAGKSTIANLVENALGAAGYHTYALDGDNLRYGLNKDLGFTEADRVENIRRAAEVARLMADAGLIVIVSLISPFRRERQLARDIAGDLPFLEVFVDAPLAVCEARDPKGLYAKVRAGQLRNFTGVDSPYEPPENPDVRLPTSSATPQDLSQRLLHRIMSLVARA